MEGTQDGVNFDNEVLAYLSVRKVSIQCLLICTGWVDQ